MVDNLRSIQALRLVPGAAFVQPMGCLYQPLFNLGRRVDSDKSSHGGRHTRRSSMRSSPLSRRRSEASYKGKRVAVRKPDEAKNIMTASIYSPPKVDI